MENTVIALYTFVPSDDSQLKFVAGDELSVLQTDPSGWWYGESLNGSSGWFPSNFVKQSIKANRKDSDLSPGPSPDVTCIIDHALKTDSIGPNKITPTFSWKNEISISNQSSQKEISILCDEIMMDLEKNNLDSISKKGEALLSLFKVLLSELPNEGVQEQKSWISALTLSFSKMLRAGVKQANLELVEEMKLIVKGLADASNDLLQTLYDKRISSDKYSCLSSQDRLIRNCRAGEGKYPSPIQTDSLISLSRSSIREQSSDLLFDKNGKVKSGNIGSLLMYLKDYKNSDFPFRVCFLTTYKLFFSSMDLYLFLKESLEIKPIPGMSEDEEKKWKETTYFQSLFTILSITRTWIENYLLLESNDSNLIDPLIDLATNHIENILPRSGEQLHRILVRRLRNVKNMPVQLECPSPILPKNLDRMRFLELDPVELARQISIMYCDRISKMHAHDILFSHKQMTGDLKSMLSFTKKVSSWVSYSLLLEKNAEKRVLLLIQFILLAEQCLCLNNFQTMNDIVRGLKAGPVYRLSKTWRALPSKIYKIFQYLSSLASSKDYFAEYRAVLKTVKGPCVPLLHCHLDDLRKTHSNHSTYNELGMINFTKMNMLSETIHQVLACHVHRYAFIRVPAFHVYFNQSFADEADEDTKYKLSYSLEPHSAQANRNADQSALKSLQQLGMI